MELDPDDALEALYRLRDELSERGAAEHLFTAIDQLIVVYRRNGPMPRMANSGRKGGGPLRPGNRPR